VQGTRKPFLRYATIDPVSALGISNLASSCSVLLACSTICDPIVSAASLCSLSAGCYCPAVLSFASSCSECYATIDPSYALAVSSDASSCSEIFTLSSSNSTTTSAKTSSATLPLGAIAGIAVGSIVGLAGIAILLFLFSRRRHRDNGASEIVARNLDHEPKTEPPSGRLRYPLEADSGTSGRLHHLDPAVDEGPTINADEGPTINADF
jgi:hypothetical protein